jgi:hypothetical protein
VLLLLATPWVWRMQADYQRRCWLFVGSDAWRCGALVVRSWSAWFVGIALATAAQQLAWCVGVALAIAAQLGAVYLIFRMLGYDPATW